MNFPLKLASGNETLVIDCSLTMAWYFADEATSYSNALRDSLISETAIVPALWPLEVANTLIMGECRKRATRIQATQWLQALCALPIAVDNETAFHAFDTILTLARDHALTSYDAAYLELALRRSLPLATLDKALQKAAKKAGVALYKTR